MLSGFFSMASAKSVSVCKTCSSAEGERRLSAALGRIGQKWSGTVACRGQPCDSQSASPEQAIGTSQVRRFSRYPCQSITPLGLLCHYQGWLPDERHPPTHHSTPRKTYMQLPLAATSRNRHTLAPPTPPQIGFETPQIAVLGRRLRTHAPAGRGCPPPLTPRTSLAHSRARRRRHLRNALHKSDWRHTESRRATTARPWCPRPHLQDAAQSDLGAVKMSLWQDWQKTRPVSCNTKRFSGGNVHSVIHREENRAESSRETAKVEQVEARSITILGKQPGLLTASTAICLEPTLASIPQTLLLQPRGTAST